MKEYQRKRKNPYLLPHPLYMKILYLIRDYERLKTITLGVPSKTLAEHKKKRGVIREVVAIEKAMEKIPEFFREPIYNNIVSNDRYPAGADERTFRRYKQRFIYYVAEALGEISFMNKEYNEDRGV